ncbi:hypothetical protein H105_04593 [Trichophyton soudanense CBS 452.61]|uniref:Hsp70-like protein n=1 Tax=Trichophyton soudanense CBS 452.61 TaxID=1215331 RepID=A0A022XS84_TRISD|nr:hypothetical protein H105_04593 [Trichophyton soudanense CBS 452.61]
MAPRTPRKSPQTTSRHKIMVGIDYGTTFTGKEAVIVWKNVIVIGTWPGPSRDSETVFKAPSRIAYPLDNPANSTIRWGFQVEPGMTTYSWTKLLVDRNIALGEFDDPTLEEASKTGILQLSCGKSAVGVVADFLKEVRAHVLKMIEKRITKEMLGITPIEYCCLQRAGFAYNIKRPNDQISMVTEPEAAAIAALNKTATDGLGASFKPDDGVLVCDCGGGTVDITTYLINKVDPILSFEEPCTGIGGKCGSTAIDRNSYRLMSRRFGKAFDMLPAKKKGPGSEYMRKFEIIKKDFGFNIEEDKIYELPLNMRANKVKAEYFDDEERLVLLSSDDIRQLFDPVVDQVIGLVRKQIDDAEDAESGIIVQKILVGGFGDSEYLREKMEKSFCGIIITVPDNPLPFRQGIDSEKNAHVDEFTRKKMVGGIMKWMIFKGEKYTENHTHTVDYNQVYRSGRSMIIKSVLFSSDSNEAPERVERTSIKKVGTICVDITDIDSNLLEKRLIDGVLSYHVEFSVKVIFGAQDGVLRFETTSQGKLVGKTTIDFTNTKYY